MKRLIKPLGIIMATIMLLAACNRTTPSPSTPDPNDKKIQDALFKNPTLDDLPMVQMHASSKSLIDDVYNRGYGGIVMNVAWSSTYLNNSREWSTFADCVKYAIEKGMHVWIYDEYGYPSGAAYGQTLKDNPEYEAMGLVPRYAVVKAGKSATVTLYHGHNRIVAAYVYDGSSQNSMNLSSGENVSNLISADGASVTYTNRTSGDKVLVAYMSKQWYEFTHSMENWYAQQRYINMLDPEPTQKFLTITHDKYYEAVGDYFGKGIVAFFTDEPALQGNYFTISDRPRKVIDQPDLNIPIVESLNFSETLFDNFESAYGYDLRPYLVYLYNDDGSVTAKQVRMDFYELTSELFRKNYLQQTADWCDSHGVKSSGHLLLEENLYQNPWFAGNMIQLIGSMGIPGTDLLFSTARRAAQDAAITSKLASSAADFLGKKDTFAEISGAFDGTMGNLYSQINAVGVQVAMGINTFSSYYYQGNSHSREEDQIFSAAIGRMRYMTTGFNHRSKVAVYYPYEGVSAETLPTKNMWTAADGAKEISDSFSQICQTLVSKQIDYDLVDYINLGKCSVEDGALISPNGERFEAIVIPFTSALRSETVLKLIEATKAGVEVVVQDIESIVCERGKNDVAARFNEVLSKANSLHSPTAIGNHLRQKGYSYAFLDDSFATDVYITKRENSYHSVFTVVNAYLEDKSYKFTLETEGKKVKYYNPVTGQIVQVSGVSSSGNKLTFNFTLSANTTGFFVIEK